MSSKAKYLNCKEKNFIVIVIIIIIVVIKMLRRLLNIIDKDDHGDGHADEEEEHEHMAQIESDLPFWAEVILYGIIGIIIVIVNSLIVIAVVTRRQLQVLWLRQTLSVCLSVCLAVYVCLSYLSSQVQLTTRRLPRLTISDNSEYL